MKISVAYRLAWDRRRLVIPVILGVRLLSFAVIAPLTGILTQIAVSLSGQSALTDQDIAYFIASPLGFPVVVTVAAIAMIGSVVGLAALTVDLHATPEVNPTPISGRASGFVASLAAIRAALRSLGVRFAALLRYAAELTLRVLIIALPFAVIAMATAHWLISDYDINYYLSTHPPEFVTALAIGATLLTALTVILLERLSGWAVSMHYVLFAGMNARAAFRASRVAMAGHRVALLKNLILWVAIRAGIMAVVGLIFAALIKLVPTVVDDAFVAWIVIVAGLAVLWSLSGMLITALSLGALAQILDTYYDGPRVAPTPTTTTPLSRVVSPLSVAAVIVGLLGVGLYTASELMARVQSDRDVLVIGHRGAAATRPENTLAAFQEAVDRGADWVEIDVQETADGEVVVIHDSDFMKLAGNPLKIWDATMEDLADIDIGSWFDPAYGDQRVATLAEVLEITRDRATLLIELKYYGHDVDLENRVVAIVEAAGMGDQVAIMSLKYQGVQKMRDLRPDWPAGVLATTSFGDITSLDVDFIAVGSGLAGPRLVRSAHERGQQVFVWTINDPLEMSAMISLGVDGLITDETAMARDVLAWRDELSPPERLFVMILDQLGLTDQFGSADDLRP